jgi:hypothetical protein
VYKNVAEISNCPRIREKEMAESFHGMDAVATTPSQICHPLFVRFLA